jgi:hypothetical protein
MLEILPAPDHVAAYRLSDTLTEADYEKVIADIEARLDRHERVSVVADLAGFHDITVRAGLMDLRYGFSKILSLNRFPKEALITDKQWLATMAQMMSPLVPFVEIRTFKPGETDAAVAWAADIDPGTKAKIDAGG